MNIKALLRAIFIIGLIFYTTFGLLLPKICENWVYSMYFKEHLYPNDHVKRVMELNDNRLVNALEYFDSLKNPIGDDTAKLEYTKNNDVLVITVISSSRELSNYKPNYITQTLASIHRLSHLDTLFPHKKIILCNVNSDPSSLESLTVLEKHFHIISRFDIDTKELLSTDPFIKAKDDYSFCMEQSYNPDSKYIVLFEDDVILNNDFFKTLYYHIYTSLEFCSHSGQSWAFIKLFYPEKWSGYGKELSHILERIGTFIVGGSLTVVILFIYNDLILKRRSLKYISIMLAFIIGAIYFLLFTQTIGRPYVTEWIHYITGLSRIIPAKDCCTQAVLYPSQLIPRITQHLRNSSASRENAHDIILDKWAVDNKYNRYLIEPNMVQHIGMISTAKTRAKKAKHFLY